MAPKIERIVTAPKIEMIVTADIVEEGAVDMTPTQLKRFADEEERRAKREEKLEEMRVMARLKEAREGIKVVRRRSVSMMEECSSTISDYYKSINSKELSTHIKSRFDAWDTDHSQGLDTKELTEAMAAMGKRPTSDEVDLLMLRVDKDGSGVVELDEFEHMVRESLGLHLEVCTCRMCEAARTEAVETAVTEAKEVAEAIKTDMLAAKLAAKLGAGAADSAPPGEAKGKAGKR